MPGNGHPTVWPGIRIACQISGTIIRGCTLELETQPPDSELDSIPVVFNLQTERGKAQARAAGRKIRKVMEADRAPFSLFFYTSPYKRSKQTHEEITSAFDSKLLVGAQEEVQLREQVRFQKPFS